MLRGRLFAIGGEHNNGCASGSTPVTDVEVLEPAWGDDDDGLAYGGGGVGWSVEGAIPEPKFRFAAAAVDARETIFVFGGQAAEQANCSAGAYAYCYPVTNHTWAFYEPAAAGS